jgi:hypothetical protein
LHSLSEVRLIIHIGGGVVSLTAGPVELASIISVTGMAIAGGTVEVVRPGAAASMGLLTGISVAGGSVEVVESTRSSSVDVVVVVWTGVDGVAWPFVENRCR